MNVVASCVECGLVHTARVPGDQLHAELVAGNLQGMPCPRCSGELQVVARAPEDAGDAGGPDAGLATERLHDVAYARGRLDGWDACLIIVRAVLDDANDLGEAKEWLTDAIEASVENRDGSSD